MAAIQIRLSQHTVDELREVGKDFGEPTDDVTTRTLILEYKRMKTEIELLKMKLGECKSC